MNLKLKERKKNIKYFQSEFCKKLDFRTAGSPLGSTATKISFMHSFSGNSVASVPIFTFMCLWAIYIFPGSVHIFPAAEYCRQLEYINRLQTHECGNWIVTCGCAIPFLGIFLIVLNLRYWFFAVGALQRQKCREFETNILRKGISGPQSQFPHSCVCESIIYSHDGSAFSAGGNMWTDPGII